MLRSMQRTFLAGVSIVAIIILSLILWNINFETKSTIYSPPVNINHPSSEPSTTSNHSIYLAVLTARNITIPSDIIIVRAAYHDPRPRDSFPHTLVFLAEVRKDLVGEEGSAKIVACGSKEHVSRSLKLRVAGNSRWVHKHHESINHDPVMIDCFGLPEFQSGTRVFLWFDLHGDRNLRRVEAENSYFIPQQKESLARENPTVVVCLATARDVPHFLREFLRYCKYLGVDHVYMVAEDSLVSQGALEGDEFVKKALMDGFISFSFWHMWLSKNETYHHSQNACL